MSIKKYMKEYHELSDAEKVRRLEIIAQCYASWLNTTDWKESPFLDATQYWYGFENALKEVKS